MNLLRDTAPIEQLAAAMTVAFCRVLPPDINQDQAEDLWHEMVEEALPADSPRSLPELERLAGDLKEDLRRAVPEPVAAHTKPRQPRRGRRRARRRSPEASPKAHQADWLHMALEHYLMRAFRGALVDATTGNLTAHVEIQPERLVLRGARRLDFNPATHQCHQAPQ